MEEGGRSGDRGGVAVCVMEEGGSFGDRGGVAAWRRSSMGILWAVSSMASVGGVSGEQPQLGGWRGAPGSGGSEAAERVSTREERVTINMVG